MINWENVLLPQNALFNGLRLGNVVSYLPKVNGGIQQITDRWSMQLQAIFGMSGTNSALIYEYATQNKTHIYVHLQYKPMKRAHCCFQLDLVLFIADSWVSMWYILEYSSMLLYERLPNVCEVILIYISHWLIMYGKVFKRIECTYTYKYTSTFQY